VPADSSCPTLNQQPGATSAGITNLDTSPLWSDGDHATWPGMFSMDFVMQRGSAPVISAMIAVCGLAK